jgi:hypothetical protein
VIYFKSSQSFNQKNQSWERPPAQASICPTPANSLSQMLEEKKYLPLRHGKNDT